MFNFIYYSPNLKFNLELLTVIQQKMCHSFHYILIGLHVP